ncbi:MAG: hypothetical protein IID37_12935 [Planctomycetes bacterium]|nr:hypothetical protein [Planctomycetota bacterium]
MTHWQRAMTIVFRESTDLAVIRSPWITRWLSAIVCLAWLVGCAGPGPTLMPEWPIAQNVLPSGAIERFYDSDNDGRQDYYERLSADGRITVLGYDTDGDGRIDRRVDLERIDPATQRDLVILLDSIPYEMVCEQWDKGRFRLFPRPTRVISPFPVMTDLSFAEFFDVSPCPGMESIYFDGRHIVGGVGQYLTWKNSPWLTHVDYSMRTLAHGVTYYFPLPWFGHELKRIEDLVGERAAGTTTVAYCVGTSAVGANSGRAGHLAALVKLDRFCRSIVRRSEGRVRISLLSDHGHTLTAGRLVRLAAGLERLGYHVGRNLKGEDAVVVTPFGMVSCAAIYTNAPAAVARDALDIDGVRLTAYRDGDSVVVVGRDGQARIHRSSFGYRYDVETGDPLRLTGVIDGLHGSGHVDSEGFAADGRLFDATIDHDFPDALHRLWRAFQGLMEYVPDVLVSLDSDRFCGSGTMTAMFRLEGIHGDLGLTSSTGFAMSMAGPLPAAIRMEDLRDALRRVGAEVPPASE